MGVDRSLVRAALAAIIILEACATFPTRWQNLSWVKTCSDAEFHETSILLGNATFLSYTSTFGSYYDPKYDNVSLVGWARNYDHVSNPSEGGMRALLFTQEEDTRHTPTGIIVFRGTDVGSAEPSHSADECADTMLWDDVAYTDLPENCKASFSAHQLDYLQRALDFIAEVRESFPGINLMLTGHSLGAGLAVLATGIQNNGGSWARGQEVAEQGFIRAMGFAAPGVNNVLKKKGIGSLNPSKIVALGDVYDPVFVSSLCPSDTTSGSTICTWRSNATESCDKCYEHFNSTDVACRVCFEERHVYKHYNSVLIPGPRPSCDPRIPDPWGERCAAAKNWTRHVAPVLVD